MAHRIAPSNAPSQTTFNLKSHTDKTTSYYEGGQRVSYRGYKTYSFDYRYAPMAGALSEQWIAFFSRLNGDFDTFQIPIFQNEVVSDITWQVKTIENQTSIIIDLPKQNITDNQISILQNDDGLPLQLSSTTISNGDRIETFTSNLNDIAVGDLIFPTNTSNNLKQTTSVKKKNLYLSLNKVVSFDRNYRLATFDIDYVTDYWSAGFLGTTPRIENNLSVFSGFSNAFYNRIKAGDVIKIVRLSPNVSPGTTESEYKDFYENYGRSYTVVRTNPAQRIIYCEKLSSDQSYFENIYYDHISSVRYYVYYKGERRLGAINPEIVYSISNLASRTNNSSSHIPIKGNFNEDVIGKNIALIPSSGNLPTLVDNAYENDNYGIANNYSTLINLNSSVGMEAGNNLAWIIDRQIYWNDNTRIDAVNVDLDNNAVNNTILIPAENTDNLPIDTEVSWHVSNEDFLSTQSRFFDTYATYDEVRNAFDRNQYGVVKSFTDNTITYDGNPFNSFQRRSTGSWQARITLNENTTDYSLIPYRNGYWVEINDQINQIVNMTLIRQDNEYRYRVELSSPLRNVQEGGIIKDIGVSVRARLNISSNTWRRPEWEGIVGFNITFREAY